MGFWPRFYIGVFEMTFFHYVHLLFPIFLWTFIFPFLSGLLFHFSLFSLDFYSIPITFWISSKFFLFVLSLLSFLWYSFPPCISSSTWGSSSPDGPGPVNVYQTETKEDPMYQQTKENPIYQIETKESKEPVVPVEFPRWGMKQPGLWSKMLTLLSLLTLWINNFIGLTMKPK